MQPRRRLTRCRTWISASVLGTLAALSVTACGSSAPPTFSEAAPVLTKQQVKAALLTPSQLGKDFVVDRSPEAGDGGDNGDLGCLTGLDDDSGPEPAAEAEVAFMRAGKLGLPTVNTSIASFESTDEMIASMEAFASATEGCKKLKDVNIKGMTFNASVSTDNVPSLEAVDEQFNVRVSGTLEARKSAVKVPFGFWVSLVRVDNHGVLVMVTDVNPASARLLNKYTVKAVERLAAVARGDLPEPAKPTESKPTRSDQPNA